MTRKGECNSESDSFVRVAEVVHNQTQSRVEVLYKHRENRDEVSRESPDKEVNRRPTSRRSLLLSLFFFYTPGSIDPRG